ncbi:MAG: hypothetical protein AB7T49_01185 [Oligoflexales bacterium]
MAHLLIGSVISALTLNACSKKDDDDDTVAADTENFTLLGAGEGATALAATPSIAKISVYQFAVSENEDCSDATVVIDNGDTPQEFDMLESPEIGKGVIPDGTYPCVIMVMSPELTAAAGEDEGVCEKDKEFSQNVCGRGDDGSTVDLNGDEQECSSAEDKAYLYLSTLSTLTDEYQDAECHGEGITCNSFAPPTDDNKASGVPLGEALVVKGDESGVFTLGNLRTAEEGDEDDPTCGLQRPSFTFTPGS